MNKKLVLENLLKKVPDTYEDFVYGVLLCSKTEEITDGLIAFMEKHPNANSSQVTDKLDQLEGLKPIEEE